jgi:hypothetical protein
MQTNETYGQIETVAQPIGSYEDVKISRAQTGRMFAHSIVLMSFYE